MRRERTVAAIALSTLLAGCGSQGPDGSAQFAASPTSTTSTSSVTTAEPTSALRLPAPGEQIPAPEFARATAAATLRGRTVQMSIVMPGETTGSVALTGRVVYHAAGRQDVSLSNGAREVRILSEVPYVHDGAAGGGKWQAWPKGSSPSAIAWLGAQLSPLAMTDGDPLPAALVTKGKVVFVGQERGKRHFRVQVSGPAFVDYFVQIAQRLYPATSTAERSAMSSSAAADRRAVAGLTAVYDVWLDGSDRLLVVTSDTRVFDRLEGRTTTTGALTGQYTWRAMAWGGSGRIESPPPAAVTSLPH